MEGLNKNKEENKVSGSIDIYGDFSKIDTKKLKSTLAAYKMNEGNSPNRAAEAIIRIEGELLRRKEVVMQDFPQEEKFFEDEE